MSTLDEFYTERETMELVDDMGAFLEFIRGWVDAVKFEPRQVYYKRKFVDLWLTRPIARTALKEEKG